MIPLTNRFEWEELIIGGTNPKLSSLTLQLKLNALRLDLKLKKLDMNAAIKELRDFCVANEKLIQKDLNIIFSGVSSTLK